MALSRARVYGFAFKIETTSGTDAVPDPAVDAVATVGVPTITIDYLEAGTRDDVQTGVLITPDRAPAAGRFGKIDVTVEVKGGGAAGTPPDVDALLRASGFSKTVSGGVSVLYTTLDTGLETGTAYCWTGNKLFKLVGCAASFKIAADAAKRGMMTFSITGKLAADPTEASLPGTLAFTNIAPALFHSAAANIGAWTSASTEALQLLSVSIDTASTIASLPSAGATDGLVGFVLSDRKTAQTMRVRTPALATFDPFAVSKAAGSATPTTAWQLGQASGFRQKVTTGRWALTAPRLADADSVSVYDLAGTLGPGASGASAREIALLYD
jgi:hypothetical protein